MNTLTLSCPLLDPILCTLHLTNPDYYDTKELEYLVNHYLVNLVFQTQVEELIC